MALSKKKSIMGLSVAAVIIIAIVVISAKKNGNHRTTVQTEAAGKKSIVETVTANGKIEPRTKVKISADVAAKIIHLGVKEGDWVEKGDLLVRLDQERYIASLEQSEANLRSVKANANLAHENLLKAQKDFERIQQLMDQNLESQATFDQVFSAVQIEKARYQSTLELVDQAQAAVKQARDNLSKTTIYSPMAGTISTLNKEVGEIALGSQFQEDVIMIVSNLSQMEALVNVDENDIVNVSLNDSATIEIDALPDRVFHGMVREIASSARISGLGSTEQKTEFEVKLSIIDAVEELRPGMTASTDIIIETRDSTLCVPLQCVTVRTPEQLKKGSPAVKGKEEGPVDSTAAPRYIPDKDGFVPVVFVIEGGLAQAMQVKTGIQSDTHIEIISGLSEGDDVVTGNYRAISQILENATPVIVKNNGPKNR
ncbi:MAG: efflux RND transporter periplasmic adaptor subunit [Candidatus Krumholzibacteriota bacterium]|nr:efflux RND transporter periplasmic adaptor subunit [Candidatus Krumholzibacteriota bacterium]